jgi:hypothetical protein
MGAVLSWIELRSSYDVEPDRRGFTRAFAASESTYRAGAAAGGDPIVFGRGFSEGRAASRQTRRQSA